MVFKKLSKIVTLSLTLLIAVSATSAKATNTDSKINRVLRFGQVMFGIAALAFVDKVILQPGSQLAFNTAEHYSRNEEDHPNIALLNTTGYTLKYCKYPCLLLAGNGLNRILFGPKSDK